jgi:hypothetical protein
VWWCDGVEAAGGDAAGVPSDGCGGRVVRLVSGSGNVAVCWLDRACSCGHFDRRQVYNRGWQWQWRVVGSLAEPMQRGSLFDGTGTPGDCGCVTAVALTSGSGWVAVCWLDRACQCGHFDRRQVEIWLVIIKPLHRHFIKN